MQKYTKHRVFVKLIEQKREDEVTRKEKIIAAHVSMSIRVRFSDIAPDPKLIHIHRDAFFCLFPGKKNTIEWSKKLEMVLFNEREKYKNIEACPAFRDVTVTDDVDNILNLLDYRVYS
jgi:hypothetical protein